MVTGSTSGEIEQATERCPRCAECKMCKQLKDKKGTSAQAEQQYIKNCVTFNQREGKFYAKLPWKIDPSLLQGNRKIAEKSHVQAKQKEPRISTHGKGIHQRYGSKRNPIASLKVTLRKRRR